MRRCDCKDRNIDIRLGSLGRLQWRQVILVLQNTGIHTGIDEDNTTELQFPSSPSTISFGVEDDPLKISDEVTMAESTRRKDAILLDLPLSLQHVDGTSLTCNQTADLLSGLHHD